MRYLLIVMLIVAAGCEPTSWMRATAPQLHIGDPELLYTDAQLPYTMDVSLATLRIGDNEMQFYRCGDWRQRNYRHSGTLAAPFTQEDWQKPDPDNSYWDYNGWYDDWHWVYFWICNLYEISDNELLAFLHIEKMTCKPQFGCDHYAMGLGYSDDRGESWTFCGEVVRPQHDRHNIGGMPYIVRDGYFQVYFNDSPTNESRNIAAARAKVDDVIAAARQKKVTPWKKYADGAWLEDGLTGLGDHVLPDPAGEYPMLLDVHADAVYCHPLDKYLLTIQTHHQGRLLMYSSGDGVNWGPAIVIEDTGPKTYMHAYSFFAAMDDETTNDCHQVGNEFYLYYPRKTYNKYAQDEFYRRKITVR